MTQPKPLWMARLVGTQAEMGAQHGRLAAREAAALLAFYKTMPERTLAGDMRGIAGLAGRTAVRGLATAWQARLLRDRPADFAERSRAFVDAVAAAGELGSKRDGLLALATMDSMQNCVSLVARARLGPFTHAIAGRAAAAAVPACSTVIAWGDATESGELLFARNFDFPGVGVWDAAPAFVVCKPDHGQSYGFFATRGADTPVVTVVNEAGLVLAPHTRWHRDVTFGGTMIVDLVHSIARRAETLDDAVRIARELKASSSWGIAIGSAREKSALVLELAGPHVDVVRAHGSYLVCANRYRSPSLQAGEFAASAAWSIHSDRREQRLRGLVEARTAPLTARTLAGFLGDRRDVAAPQLSRHLGAIVAQSANVHCAVIAPASRSAWVGVDRAPCCEGTWAELRWSWAGPAGAWHLGESAGSGFDATTRDDFAAPHDAATLHVHDAARAYEGAHDVAAARIAIERAVAIAPEDPSLRITAAWLALEEGAADRAIAHVHAGLAAETEAYRRGQLLLWGSRAAQRLDPALARRWSDELSRLSGDGVDELKAARGPWRRRPHVNLMMSDAY
ncbi:MAG: peptidase acyl-coenzyme A:6-aminopenicillanic acid acyl-transferase [Myxococcales bacterium]|nr:peptidase acyl-coenzyme A:6-aminopenicillanic acid acyl-transferase [Myxococcales bacterium]